MKKPPFLNDQIYHVFNRGVEKRDVFMEDGDNIRFMHHLFEFNNTITSSKNLRRDLFKMYEVGPRTFIEKSPFVDILGFVLMPNHYHLLLRQKVDGGIVKFMHKIGTGYTLFFNKKYDRVGSLFQGNFKAVLIESDAHFNYILHYIHLNPIPLLSENVRGPTSYIEKIEFLKNYKWSSFQDYIGKKNFPSITQRDFFLKFFDGTERYKEDITEFLQEEKLHDNEINNSILLDFEKQST